MEKVLGNYRKAHYRTRTGQRLNSSQYKRRRKIEICLHLSVFILALVLVFSGIAFLIKKIKGLSDSEIEQVTESATAEITVVETVVDEEEPKVEEINPYLQKSEDSSSFFEGYNVEISSDTAYIASENTKSNYAVLVNLDTGKVEASKDGNVRINPASMTKILTLLVAAEHIDDLEGTYTMTQEIGNFVFSKDCSAVGLKVGDVQTVRDMMYGTILPSGADAAMMLAEYVAGSQEAFVEMMNEKLDELGLSDTAHFTNCIGIYDQNHYCTLTDMAMILKAAEENALCHEILNARTYTTSPTSEHPEGITISNWFMRRIEDKDTNGEVMGAKTGFVNQSGCCGASYQISNDGSHYICVTADAWSSWRCIYDHVDIYKTYTS